MILSSHWFSVKSIQKSKFILNTRRKLAKYIMKTMTLKFSTITTQNTTKQTFDTVVIFTFQRWNCFHSNSSFSSPTRCKASAVFYFVNRHSYSWHVFHSTSFVEVLKIPKNMVLIVIRVTAMYLWWNMRWTLKQKEAIWTETHRKKDVKRFR